MVRHSFEPELRSFLSSGNRTINPIFVTMTGNRNAFSDIQREAAAGRQGGAEYGSFDFFDAKLPFDHHIVHSGVGREVRFEPLVIAPKQ